jgi:hypothetical protein
MILCLSEDTMASGMADVVVSKDLLLSKEPPLAKLASRTKKIDCALNLTLLWCCMMCDAHFC